MEGVPSVGRNTGKKRKTGRRSSILKMTKSPSRTALCEINANADMNTTRSSKSRRVSFAHTYQLKEFQKDASPQVPVIDPAETALDTGMAPAGRQITGLQSLLSGPLENQTAVTLQESAYTVNHIQEVPMPNESDDSGFLPVNQTASLVRHPADMAASSFSNVSSNMAPASSSESMYRRWDNDSTKCFDFSSSAMNFTMCNDENAPPVSMSSSTGDKTQLFKDSSGANMDMTECMSGFPVSGEGNRTLNTGDKTQVFTRHADGMETTVCVGGVITTDDLSSKQKSLTFSKYETHTQNKTCYFDNDTSSNDMDFTTCASTSLQTSISNLSAGSMTGRSQLIDTQAFLAGLMTKTQPGVVSNTASSQKKSSTDAVSRLLGDCSDSSDENEAAPKLDAHSFLSSLMKKSEPEIMSKTSRATSPGTIDTSSFLASLSNPGSGQGQKDDEGFVGTAPSRNEDAVHSVYESNTYLSNLEKHKEGAKKELSSQEAPAISGLIDTKNFLAGLAGSGSTSGHVDDGDKHFGERSLSRDKEPTHSMGKLDAHDFLASLTRKSASRQETQSKISAAVSFAGGSDSVSAHAANLESFEDSTCANMDMTECMSGFPISGEGNRTLNAGDKTQVFSRHADGMETTVCVGGVITTDDLSSKQKSLNFSKYETRTQNTQNKTRYFDNDTSSNDMDFTACADTSLQTSISNLSAGFMTGRSQLIDTQAFLAGLMTKTQPGAVSNTASSQKKSSTDGVSRLLGDCSDSSDENEAAPKLDAHSFLSSLRKKSEPEIMSKTSRATSPGTIDTSSFLASLSNSGAGQSQRDDEVGGVVTTLSRNEDAVYSEGGKGSTLRKAPTSSGCISTTDYQVGVIGSHSDRGEVGATYLQEQCASMSESVAEDDTVGMELTCTGMPLVAFKPTAAKESEANSTKHFLHDQTAKMEMTCMNLPAPSLSSTTIAMSECHTDVTQHYSDSDQAAGMEMTCTDLPVLSSSGKLPTVADKHLRTTRSENGDKSDKIEMTCIESSRFDSVNTGATGPADQSNIHCLEEDEGTTDMEFTCTNLTLNTVNRLDQTANKVKFSDMTKVFEDGEDAQGMEMTCIGETANKVKLSDMTKVFEDGEDAQGMEMTCIGGQLSVHGMSKQMLTATKSDVPDVTRRFEDEEASAGMELTCVNRTSLSTDIDVNKATSSDLTRVFGDGEQTQGMEMTCMNVSSAAEIKLDQTKAGISDVTRRFEDDDSTGGMELTCMNLTVPKVSNDVERTGIMEMTCMQSLAETNFDPVMMKGCVSDTTQKFDLDESAAGMEFTCMNFRSVSANVTSSVECIAADALMGSSSGNKMKPADLPNITQNFREKGPGCEMELTCMVTSSANSTRSDLTVADRSVTICTSSEIKRETHLKNIDGAQSVGVELKDMTGLEPSVKSASDGRKRDSVPNVSCRFEDSVSAGIELTCMSGGGDIVPASDMNQPHVSVASTVSGSSARDQTIQSESTSLMEVTSCADGIQPPKHSSDTTGEACVDESPDLPTHADIMPVEDHVVSGNMSDVGMDKTFDKASAVCQKAVDRSGKFTSSDHEIEDGDQRKDVLTGTIPLSSKCDAQNEQSGIVTGGCHLNTDSNYLDEWHSELDSYKLLIATKSAPIVSSRDKGNILPSLATAPGTVAGPVASFKVPNADYKAVSVLSSDTLHSHQSSPTSEARDGTQSKRSPKRSSSEFEQPDLGPAKVPCTQGDHSDRSLPTFEDSVPTKQGVADLPKPGGRERQSSDDHSASDLENEVLPEVPLDTDTIVSEPTDEMRMSQIHSSSASAQESLPSKQLPLPGPSVKTSPSLPQTEATLVDTTRRSGRDDLSEWSTFHVSSINSTFKMDSFSLPYEFNTFDDYLRFLDINVFTNAKYRHSSIHPDYIPVLETLSEKLEVHCVTQHEADLFQLCLEQLTLHTNRMDEMSSNLEAKLMQDPPQLLHDIRNGSEEELERLKVKYRQIISVQQLMAKTEFKEWNAKMQKNLMETLEDEETLLQREVEKFEVLNKKIDDCLQPTDALSEQLNEHLTLMEISRPSEEQQNQLDELEKLNNAQLEELKKAKEELLLMQQEYDSVQQQVQNMEQEMINLQSIKNVRRESEKLIKVNAEQIDNLRGCLEWEFEQYDDKLIFVTFLWKSLDFKIDLGDPLESDPEYQHIIDMNFETHITEKALPANVFVHRIILEHLSTTKLRKKYPTTKYLRELLLEVSEVFCDARLLGEDLAFNMGMKIMTIRGCKVTVKTSNPMAQLMFDITFTYDPATFQYALPTWKIKSFSGEGMYENNRQMFYEDLQGVLKDVSPGVGHFCRLINAIEDFLSEKAKLRHQEGYTLGFKVVEVGS